MIQPLGNKLSVEALVELAATDKLIIGYHDSSKDNISALAEEMNLYLRLYETEKNWRDLLHVFDCSKPFKHGDGGTFRSLEHALMFEMVRLVDQEQA